MKKILLSALLLLFSYTLLFAGGTEQFTNQSAEYVKTLNRNASIETDAVYYNPAGTAFMESGVYVYLSNQTIIQPLTITAKTPGHKTYEGDRSSYYFPNIFLIYNRANTGPGDAAVSLGFLNIGGRAGGVFDDGLPSLDQANLYSGTKKTSEYRDLELNYSLQFNFAYAFLEKRMSISAGYRFVYVSNRLTGKLKTDGVVSEKIEGEQTGLCHGFIAGIAGQPVKDLIIGVRYEWHSGLVLKTDAENAAPNAAAAVSYTADSSRARRTIPMNLAAGISYSIIGIKMEFDFTYFLNSEADWNGLEKKYDNGYETGFGIDYTFPAAPVNIGVGYLFAKDGGNKKTRTDFREGLDSHSAGAGLSYRVISNLKITLAYAFTYFMPNDVATYGSGSFDGRAGFEKMGHNIALGLEYKAL